MAIARWILVWTLAACGMGCHPRPPAPVSLAGLTICLPSGQPASSLRQMAKDFTATSGVPVQVITFGLEDYHDQVLLRLARGTDLDVVAVMGHWLALARRERYLIDLSEFLKRDLPLVGLHPRLRETLGETPPRSGTYIAIPFYPDLPLLAYRADWLADPLEQEAFQRRHSHPLTPPRNWEEAVEVAAFFRRPEQNRYGIVVPSGRRFNGLVRTFHHILTAEGGRLYDPENNRLEGQVNGEIAQKAFYLLRALIDTGPTDAHQADPNRVVHALVGGQCALALITMSQAEGIRDALGERVAFAPLPGADHPEGQAMMEGLAFAIPAQLPPDRQQRAMAFLSWWYQPETQARWLARGGLPLQTEDFSDPVFQNRAYAAAFTSSVAQATVFWNIPAYLDVMRLMQKQLGDALDGYQSMPEALNKLAYDGEVRLRAHGLLTVY